MHSLAGVEADDRLRKPEQGGYAAIVKAAPKLRLRFCLFLRVDRDRAEGNPDLFPIARQLLPRMFTNISRTSI